MTRLNFTTRERMVSRQLEKLPKARQVKIRRTIGARGFYHKGRVVEEGETIECDHDIAATLVALGKAEFAPD